MSKASCGSSIKRVSSHALIGALPLLGLVFGASPAAAASCTGAPTVACVFSFTGSQQTFTVPAGVRSLHVLAFGGHGGFGFQGPTGGLGGRVEGDQAVTQGSTLYVEVGGDGANGGEGIAGGEGGFNGGGTGGEGGWDGGGGGGASDIRTSPSTLASRLFVAGGGGGGGGFLFGGAGGPAGGPGNNATPGSTGGGAGTLLAGGEGSAGNDGAESGSNGIFGIGGTGGSAPHFDGGGGGGGGLYGGGGAGGNDEAAGSAGGGGGGSSSAGSLTNSSVGTDTSKTPTSITITYLSPAALLGELLEAVQGVGPGRSLAEKVGAAQAALAAERVADTCNILSAFIREVDAQKGKHIKSAKADELIAAAKQIQAALGCAS